MQQPQQQRGRGKRPGGSSSSSALSWLRLSGFKLSGARSGLLLAGAIILLVLHVSRRDSPHTRRLRRLAMTSASQHEGQLASAAAAATASTTRQSGASALSSRNVTGGGAAAADAGGSFAAGAGAGTAGSAGVGAGVASGSGASGGASGGGSGGSGSVRLWNGVMMPRIGLGTAGLGERTEEVVTWALQDGYRLIDSAQAREWYREDLVGAALQKTLPTLGISRNDLFIVSKLHPRHSGYGITLERFEDSLRDLGVPHVDLFLLHYPWCFPAICGQTQPDGSWADSWRALEEIHKRGKARAIGVSNFGVEELEELIKHSEIKPHVVQRNSDPLRADMEMQRVCAKHGIVYMAYSSLGTQWQFSGLDSNPVLSHPTINVIAARRRCAGAAQTVLAWALAHSQVVIPRSGNRQHLRDNLRTPLDCVLLPEDVREMDALDGSADNKGGGGSQ